MGREEGIEDSMPAALALPRGRVGPANLPGTASSRDDGWSRRVACDFILQHPKFVVFQPRVGPVFGERSDFDKMIELRGAL